FHSLLVRLLADFGDIRFGIDQPPDGRRHHHHLVNPEAPPIAGHAAFEATDGTIYVIGPAGLPGRNEIFPAEVRRTVVAVGYLGLALRAERAQQALRHDTEDGGVE